MCYALLAGAFALCERLAAEELHAERTAVPLGQDALVECKPQRRERCKDVPMSAKG